MVKTLWECLDSALSYNYFMIFFLPKWVLDAEVRMVNEDSMVKTLWECLDSALSYNYCMLSFLPERVLDGKGEADGEDSMGAA